MTAVEFIEPLTHEEGVSQATKLFVDTYGAAPEGVWAAPGRVNLIGEHTDYNAGLCLPIALPHRTFIALKPREDTKVRVVSDVAPDKVAEADLDGLKARGVDGWSAYPTGVAWALREAGFDKVKGFDAAFVSCVPLGSGLSSSAAMTCSTALALDDVYGLGYGDSDAGRVTLINAAIKSENEMAGASTGGLDQSASMRCTEGHALLLDCRPELTPLENVSQQEFDLDKYNLELLVVDTQAPHQLNDGQYAQRRATCEQAAKILGVANLRVTADGIAKADDQFQALKETLDALPGPSVQRFPRFAGRRLRGHCARAGHRRGRGPQERCLRCAYDRRRLRRLHHRVGGQGPFSGSRPEDRRRIRKARLPRTARACRVRGEIRFTRGMIINHNAKWRVSSLYLGSHPLFVYDQGEP